MTEEQLKEVHRLQKLTVTKLRDEVMEKYHDELKGVRGMTKVQIVEAVCKLQGIPLEEIKKKSPKAKINKTTLKAQLKGMKTDKQKLHAETTPEGRKSLGILRKKMKRIKRNLRRAA